MDYREPVVTPGSQSFQRYLVREFGTESQVYDAVVPHIFDRVVDRAQNDRHLVADVVSNDAIEHLELPGHDR